MPELLLEDEETFLVKKQLLAVSVDKCLHFLKFSVKPPFKVARFGMKCIATSQDI
jgi:hypothetical protein